MNILGGAVNKDFPISVKAVLFDYDGVIADTMADNFVAWKHSFQKFGIQISEADYYALEGMTPKAIACFLGKRYGLREKQYELLPEYKADYYRNNNKFRIYKGVYEVLFALSKMGKRLALVSGAASHRITEMTPSRVLSFFDIIISADHIEKCKPDPEGYNMALKRLGVKSGDAIVVENAPLGIQAAKNAGVYCVALTTTMSANLLNANICLASITDLTKLVSRKHNEKNF